LSSAADLRVQKHARTEVNGAAIIAVVVKRTCPICRNSVALRDENAYFPFCSERCKLVDLGNWLGEVYRVPAEPLGDGELQLGDDDDDRGGVQ